MTENETAEYSGSENGISRKMSEFVDAFDGDFFGDIFIDQSLVGEENGFFGVESCGIFWFFCKNKKGTVA